MYIRSKVVKGHTYYQVVEGVSDGGRVRQRIVLALGRTRDPRAALRRWRRELARLQLERGRWAGPEGMSKATARRIDRLDARIARLQRSAAKLSLLIRSKLIGATEKVRGWMDEFTSECGIKALATGAQPYGTGRMRRRPAADD